MAQSTQGRMANTREFRQKCAEVGARIRAFRESVGMDRAELARQLSLTDDALRKAERGETGVTQFVKLAELASALRVTPNAILGFQDPVEREAFKGLLEAAFVAQRMPLEQARPLAEVALRVLDSPELHNSGIPLSDSARSIGLYVIRRFLTREQP
jgi:transcriptional regulator with XRE-family HTH domain